MTKSHIRRLLAPRLMVLLNDKGLVSDIIEDVSRLISANGPQWTIDRYKVMKVALSGYVVGEPLGSQPNLRLVNGRPKGVWKHIFKRALDPKETKVMLQVVNLYTAFVSKAPTQPQLTKFFDSVTKAGGPIHDLADRMVRWAAHEFSDSFARVGPRNVALARELLYPLGHARLSSHRRHPLGVKTYPETSRYLDTFLYTSSWPEARELFMRFNLNMLFWRTLVPYDRYCTYAAQCHQGFEEPGPYHVGHISFIQEPGYKLRAIANPGRIWQHTLHPLKAMLWKCLKVLPWDTTFDQESGARWAQKELQKQKTLHSVDLSDATNHFPLEIQERLLQTFPKVFHPGLVGLFAELSRAPWFVPERLRKSADLAGVPLPETVRWSRGQPLGLGPSFASFALAHGMLVDTLRSELGIQGTPFRILGDDIVISDDRLFSAYMDTLKSIHVPISKLKTWSSQRRAEFAGHLIFSDRIFHLGKWRPITDDSFLDFCQNFESVRCLRLLKPRQRAVADRITCLPRDLGGQGWNPKGLPLTDRVTAALGWLNRLAPYQGEPLQGLSPGVKQRQFLENSEIASRFSFLHGMLIPGLREDRPPGEGDPSESRLIDQMRRVGLGERLIPLSLRAPMSGTLRARLQHMLDEGTPWDKVEALSFTAFQVQDDEAFQPTRLVSLERQFSGLGT